MERRRELSRRGFPATEKYYDDEQEEEDEKEEQVENETTGDEAVRDGEDDGEEFQRVEESRGQVEGSGEARKVAHV